MYPIRQDVQQRYNGIGGTPVYGKTGQISAGSASGTFIPRNFELESFRAIRTQKSNITALETRCEHLNADMTRYVSEGNEELADEAFSKIENVEKEIIRAKASLMKMQEDEDKLKAQQQQTRELLLRGVLADSMEHEVMKISNDEIMDLASKEQTLQTEIATRNTLITSMNSAAAKHAENISSIVDKAKNSPEATAVRDRRMKMMERQQDLKNVQSVGQSSGKSTALLEIEKARAAFSAKKIQETALKG
jgi:hypothetical protein